MYLGAMAAYTPNDERLGWLDHERYFPSDSYAGSTSLRKIYEIGYAREDSLGNDAEWPLCLAFGAFAVRSLLRGQMPQLVGSSVKRIGVACGFDGGDLFKLGELTRSGFKIESKRWL